MVLIGAIIFQTFTNMVRQGIVLGTIVGKLKLWIKPYQGYVEN